MNYHMKTILWLAVCFLCITGATAETITVSFAGDCTLGCDSSWNHDARAFPKIVEPEGYLYPFEKVYRIFGNDDLTIVNLEGVLTDNEDEPATGRRYHFRGREEYAAILRLGCVEAVTLANNHSHDFGMTGLKRTQSALDQYGIGWMLDDTPFIYEKNGIRIAFVGYLEDAFYNHQKELPEIVQRLKEEQGCSAVVLCLHIGTEYSEKHSYT